MRAILQSKTVARAWRAELLREGYLFASIVPVHTRSGNLAWAVHSGHVRTTNQQLIQSLS